jgi:hypothetical protein
MTRKRERDEVGVEQPKRDKIKKRNKLRRKQAPPTSCHWQDQPEWNTKIERKPRVKSGREKKVKREEEKEAKQAVKEGLWRI